MAELKTKENERSVEEFLGKVADERVCADCRKISEWMSEAAGAEPKMWGDSIVGFGSRHLKYASGRELDWMKIGFSPRKQNITLYLSAGEEWDTGLLSKLGKFKTGKGCLYIKRLSDVDEKVLRELMEKSAKND